MRFESCIFAVWCGVNWRDVGYFLDRLSRSLRRLQDLLLFKELGEGCLLLMMFLSMLLPVILVHTTTSISLKQLLCLFSWSCQLTDGRCCVFCLNKMYLIIMDSGICCMFYITGWFLSARAVFTSWQLMLLDIKRSLKKLLSYMMVLCTRRVFLINLSTVWTQLLNEIVFHIFNSQFLYALVVGFWRQVVIVYLWGDSPLNCFCLS